MNITLEIPDNIAGLLLANGGDLNRRALEAFALEEYKAERITKVQLRTLLGLERMELDGFLKTHDVTHDLPTLEEVEEQLAGLKRLGF